MMFFLYVFFYIIGAGFLTALLESWERESTINDSFVITFWPITVPAILAFAIGFMPLFAIVDYFRKRKKEKKK